MSSDEIKEEKNIAANGRDDERRMPQYEAFKSELEGLQDAVFESGAVRLAAPFPNIPEDVADYVRVKYTGRVTRRIGEVERPMLAYPARPTAKTITLSDGTTTQEKADKMDVHIGQETFNKILCKRKQTKWMFMSYKKHSKCL